jgi:hypothetical protein
MLDSLMDASAENSIFITRTTTKDPISFGSSPFTSPKNSSIAQTTRLTKNEQLRLLDTIDDVCQAELYSSIQDYRSL